MEETHHCSPTLLIISGKGRHNHDTRRVVWPFKKTQGHIHTASVCALREHPPLTLNAGETEGVKAAALKSLEVGTHLGSGPVEVTWGSLGGSEYPQSLALGYEIAQCTFTSVKSTRMHMKIFGPCVAGQFHW